MTRLPNAEAAIVEENKLKSYLLSDTHPAGRSKAAFFFGRGFSPASWQSLHDALRSHARTAEIVSVVASPFGMKYSLEGPLDVPSGLPPRLRTIWFVATGGDVPVLVTAYPAPGGVQ